MKSDQMGILAAYPTQRELPLSNQTRFSPVLMPPEDGRNRAAQIPGRGLALGPARLDQWLQVHPCSVRQHRSSSHQEEQNARNHNRFKRERALASELLEGAETSARLSEEELLDLIRG